MIGFIRVRAISDYVQLYYDRFTETHIPTIQDSYRKYFTTANGVCSLDILETGGLNNELMCPVDYYILVYSISSRDSFTLIPKLYDRLVQMKYTSTHSLSEIPPVLPQKPASRVLLVANKIDQTEKRLVSTKEGLNLAKRLGCGFLETSAKEKINVENIFLKFDFARSLRPRRQVSKKEMKTSTSLHKLGKVIPNRSKLRWK